ncbi:MAG: hypothetical protein A2Y33_05890 [Spirochaetes bacterium GWF1_51_8]|nr:MAG: hypothetical protein A2Y33_05890 [Spirochaetes bacterium GWF1_51_8]
MSTLFYHRKNSLIHLVDAGSFFIGISLCSFSVIIPSYVKSYTDNVLLLALLPIIWECGSYVPQLFSIFHAQKKRTQNPIRTYFIYEGIHRLSFILIGISILIFGNNPLLSLISFYVFFILSNLSWGLSIPHWIDTLSMTIPDNIFASFIGKRDMVARFIGIASSFALPLLLSLAVFPWNYGYLFLISGIFFTGGSFAIPFLDVLYPMKREPLHPELKFMRFIRDGLKTIVSNSELRFYLLIFWLMGSARITYAYMAPYVKDNIITLYPPESAGFMFSWYNTSFLIAVAVTSWLIGEVAHRFKQKVTAIVGVVSLVAANLLLVFIPSYISAIAANIFLGAFMNAAYLVTMTSIMESSAPDRRATLYAVNNTVTAVFIVAFSLLGSVFASLWKYRGALLLSAFLPLALLVPLLIRKPAKFRD